MRLIIILLFLLSLCGCSRRDPITSTPIYHTGTPTNRSSVQSWELNKEPLYTQPGVNSGSIVPTPSDIQEQQKYTSYNSLAHQVYAAISDKGFDMRYITVTANNGSVIIIGTVDNKETENKMITIAKGVLGVRNMITKINVINK